jgi:hypothetical protein
MLYTMADVCSLPVPEPGFQPSEGLAKSGGNSDPLKVNFTIALSKIGYMLENPVLNLELLF